MIDKKTINLVIKLLRSINKNLDTLNSPIFDDEVVFNNIDNPIPISKELYKKICKAIKSNRIDFMGIS